MAGTSSTMCETIVDIIKNTQVRLTKRMLKIIRSAHPHMESLLFDSNGKFKTSIIEIDIEKSFTVIDMSVNPWELQDSKSMEVDEGIIKHGKKSSSGSANAILTFNSGRIIFK